jgi:hypothetical protein
MINFRGIFRVARFSTLQEYRRWSGLSSVTVRDPGPLPVLCGFSDAGMTMLSTRCGGRRPKSAYTGSRPLSNGMSSHSGIDRFPVSGVHSVSWLFGISVFNTIASQSHFSGAKWYSAH